MIIEIDTTYHARTIARLYKINEEWIGKLMGPNAQFYELLMRFIMVFRTILDIHA